MMFVHIVECQVKLTSRSVTSQLWRVTAHVHIVAVYTVTGCAV